MQRVCVLTLASRRLQNKEQSPRRSLPLPVSEGESATRAAPRTLNAPVEEAAAAAEPAAMRCC